MDTRLDLLLRYSAICLTRLRQIKNILLEMDEKDLNEKEFSSPQKCCGIRTISSLEANFLHTILGSIADMNDQVTSILERHMKKVREK